MAKPEREDERGWFDEEEPARPPGEGEILGPVEPANEGELPQEMRRVSEAPMVLAVIGVGLAVMLLWYAVEWGQLQQLGGALSGSNPVWGRAFNPAPSQPAEFARPSLPPMNRAGESADAWLGGLVREAPVTAPERMALPPAPLMPSPAPSPEPSYREPQMPISSQDISR